ncbi:hypothetical protein [Sphingobium fuliginis]|uniref:Uncharacterized protein n=1 Tax=Sphingobium fuliginis ATCC 27551 TaxID=1208342 RepID=A0A5B8CFE6_SPHSA|nr:hypothetical protein [Sphingobium fuliginis]QDC38063.1 hypothetical protein FIL70_13330 [Sphingobium fuliginis ATCC 27551]
MIYVYPADRLRTMLAKNAAQAFAKMAGWRVEQCPSILPPSLADYSYCDGAAFVICRWQRQTVFNRLICVGLGWTAKAGNHLI